MYPVLKPGLRRLWRDDTTLQLGADPTSAVVLTDLTPTAAAVLDRLDGTRTRAQLLASCDDAGRDVIALVSAAGLLDDAATDPGDVLVPKLEQDRFVPDVAAMSLRAADPTYARRLVDRRRRARLRVQGAGRVGAQVATLLAAGGIGTVVVDDAGVTVPADVAPAGLRLDDVGRPRSVAATAALARVSRLSNAQRRGAPGFSPDLVVVTPVGLPVVHPAESLDLERTGVAHLLAGVREQVGVVGPLVVPGRTSCLHCQHLQRTALDPAWPLLALQMSRRTDVGTDACDVALATFVASLATMQALDFVDAGCRQRGLEPAAVDRGPEDEHFADVSSDAAHERAAAVLPASADGTLELAYPDWRIRRRSWPVHPACPCRRARLLADDPAGPAEQHGPAA